VVRARSTEKINLPLTSREQAWEYMSGCHRTASMLSVGISRRQILNLAVGVAALPALPRAARAQSYPSRPVRIIVGFPPGGASDITARLLGQWLTERLGQQFIIENRPGAGTNIGTEVVAKSPPDGYTLLLVSVANTVNATLYERLNFNFILDVAPVAALIRSPLVMEVNPSVPASSIPEFIAMAKANPGAVAAASAGHGTPAHMASELFQLLTGIDLIDVPYRGGAPALTDLLAGQVQVMFENVSTSLEYIRAGKLRALGVTTAARSDLLPELPTVSEFVPGYEVSSWFGIGAPKHTPTNIVDLLNVTINAGLSDPKLKAQLTDLSATVLPGTPADFGKFIADETEKWRKLIQAAGIKST
jgi:tripartite-type tricarboxylate transporter receptor subunit TctC